MRIWEHERHMGLGWPLAARIWSSVPKGSLILPDPPAQMNPLYRPSLWKYVGLLLSLLPSLRADEDPATMVFGILGLSPSSAPSSTVQTLC